MIKDRTRANILFSCTGQARKDYEPFVEDHALTFILNGEMIINDGLVETKFKTGEFGFILKNQLVKTQKIPQDNKLFMGISVLLPKEILYNYAKEHNIIPKGTYTGKPSFILPHDSFIKGYFDSLIPYFENPDGLTRNLTTIKTIEVIELLLKYASIQNILFCFDEDFKIDLKAYMNKNYMHNIPLEKFATLTGRSISTFKRDFQAIFTETPNKWLIKKRLDLAHFLISKKHQKPADVYFDAGFINFSHFSRTFKSEFGVNPSAIEKSHN